MQGITVDFETYYDSDFNLDKLTTEQYVRNPLFEVIGVGVSIWGGPKVWMEEYQWRHFASSVNWQEYAALGHHSHFDGLIMSHHYGVRPGYWFDTLSMARALYQTDSWLGLAELMPFLGVGEKGHTYLEVKGLRRSQFTQPLWDKYGVYCLNDADGTEKIFFKMLEGYPRVELDIIDMTIRMFTEPAFVLDEPLLQDYAVREKQRKADVFSSLEIDLQRYKAKTTKKIFGSSDKFALLLRDHGVEPVMKKSPKWTEEDPKMIYAFAKSDAAMQLLLEDEDDTIRFFAEARVEAKSTQAISRTDRFIKLGAAGQPMPVYSTYAGAHTFRSAGGDSCNWKNLKRAQKGKPDADIIKRSICAPDGYVVARADSGQIEARFTSWAAQEQLILQAFRNGEDIYSKFASKVYGRMIDRTNNPDDFIPGFVGKTCILGLGYGMGWFKLAMEFLKGALGGPPLVFTRKDMEMFGIDPQKFMHNPYKVAQVESMPSRLPIADLLVHCIVCEYIVNRYRDENENIKALWKYLNDDIIPAMADGTTGKFGHNGFLELVKGGVLLPSGLVMKYPGLHLQKKRGGRENETEWMYRAKPNRWEKIYGGLFLENFVQACTRIIVMGQALTIHRELAPVRTETYDEIVTIVPESEGPAAVNFLIQEMKRAPVWCSDLPLSASGGWHKTYGGAK